MNSRIKAKAAGLFVAAFLVFSVSLGLPVSASGLSSAFFSTDADALQVMGGTPYNMNDPAWTINVSDQNRNTFAYKIFAGLFMLGYQTEMGYNYGLGDSQLRALNAFQTQYGLPVSNMVTSACLQQMDQLLVSREQHLASIAQTFPLYNHMQPLNPNDISQDTLATIYVLPMSVLPAALQMSTYELLQCIGGQCDGFIQDANGVSIPSWPTPIDMASDYRFVGAYFDPRVYNSRLPSAAVHVDTVLHEYAHYLDNIFHWSKSDPLSTHIGSIDTTGFYNILYDLSSGSYCYKMRSSNPKDWVTKYGFNPGYGGCAAGYSVVFEEWAEAFSMYVAAGRNFRAAAQQSSLIAQQYAWLKNNVFAGLEYDTDLPRDLESGCNDVHGTSAALPGYASCSDSYIWDYTLPILQYSLTINAAGDGSGTITSSSGVIDYTYPASMTGNVALDSGTAITLTATAGSGATAAWSGDCSVAGGTPTVSTCLINTMDTAKLVTATFSMTPVDAACGSSNAQTLPATPSTGLCSVGTPGTVTGSGPWSWACQGLYGGTTAACSADVTKYSLIVSSSGTGSGSIVASTGGIGYSYPTTAGGSASLNSGMAVTLTATSDSGSAVVWSGQCDSSGGTPAVATCTISNMDAAKTVSAIFTLNQYTLTTNASGNGSGTVTSTPGGISFSYPSSDNGSVTLNYGTAVTLTANGAAGSTASWTGNCSATGGTPTAATCTISNMDAAKTVSAIFTLNQYTLTANASGTGSGTVISNPGGISFPYPTAISGSINLNYGNSVLLTATASAHSTVAWNGCDSTNGDASTATCTVNSMSAAKTVSATFTAQYTLVVNASGSGSGNISSNAGGISYGYPESNSSSAMLNSGTTVILTATPSNSIVGWTGPCSSTAGSPANVTCVIDSLITNTTVIATFSSCNFTFASLHDTVVPAGTGKSVSLTSSNPGCAWTAVSNVPWITITSGNGVGNGTVQYSVSSNTGAVRTGTIAIAGQTFTVTQGTTLTQGQIGVFRAGAWYVDRDKTLEWSGCGLDGCYDYGTAGDQAVTGDWDGTGIIRLGVFRDGNWYLDYNGDGQWNGCGKTADTDRCYTFGMPGDIPVIGDWNGNGISKIGVFRNGNWYLDYNGDGQWSGCGTTADTDRCYQFGMPGDIPVVGDWSGNGVSKIGVFRNGNWYLDYNGDGQWSGCGTTTDTDRCYTFGMPGDIPVVGDWSGNGVFKIGLFRNGMWYLDYAGTNNWVGCGAPADVSKDACVPFGMSGDIPVVLR